MRLAIVLTLLSAAIGAPTWYYLVPATANVNTPFRIQYVLMMEKQPHIVNQHVEALIGECLPQASRVSQAAKRVAAEAFSKSMLFTAENRTAEDASRELTSWAIDKVKRLSPSDQKGFLDLIRQADNSETTLCLMSGIKNSASFNFSSKTIPWELRL